MTRYFLMLFPILCLADSIKAQDNQKSENYALTFFIDSILPTLPQHDSTHFIRRESQAGLEWGTFYGLISKQPLMQSDSIMIKQFNDSIVKASYNWASKSNMKTKPWDQKIINTKSRLKVHYLNGSDKFEYLADKDFRKKQSGYCITLINSIHLDNLTITQVSLEPLWFDYHDSLIYEGHPVSYLIFLNINNKAMRYYEIVNHPKSGTINWR